MTFSIMYNGAEEARIMPTGRDLALGDLAEHFYGDVEIPDSMEDEVKVFVRAFFNWFRLMHLVGSGQGYLLDKTQRQAYHMLLDWWSGTYCDPQACVYFLLSKLAPILSRLDFLNDDVRLRWSYHEKNGNMIYKELVKADLCVVLSEQEKFSHPIVAQLEKCVSSFLEFLNHRHDTVTRTVMALRGEQFAEESMPAEEISDYNWTMWRIFQSQFCGVKVGEPPREWHISAGQRYYRDTEFLVLRNRERGRHTRIEECELSSDESDDGVEKTYLLRPLESDRLVPSNSADFMEICLSEATNFEWPEIQARNLLTANIIPYVDNGLEIYRNYPQYLWNRMSATLVKTSALVRGGPPPDYTAISHLGRRQEVGQSHIIPKGWKYPVSSVDKFKVEDLVRDLQQLQGIIDTEYIWMDLLCLPQCEEDDEQDTNGQDFQLKLLEISRQTVIFHNAEMVVDWPHESLDLSSLMGKIMVRTTST
ncbi:uncharacterized protein TrAtP1_001870 [Trichoderma atroviride]|uniref:uncharacterized protein n=1 Tax=Hypocrea atroviridis TaxID=63577 RepID=UPI00332DCE56|nr:hypothetical protein TrAtP1_001870 [Trichoderma atroviride]